MSEPSVGAFSITNNAGGSGDGKMQSSLTVTISGTSITIQSGSPVTIDADLAVTGSINAAGDVIAGGSNSNHHAH